MRLPGTIPKGIGDGDRTDHHGGAPGTRGSRRLRRRQRAAGDVDISGQARLCQPTQAVTGGSITVGVIRKSRILTVRLS